MKSSTSEINCPICKSTNFDNIGLYKNKHNFFSNIKLTKCKKCKLVFANPMPSPEELDDYNSSFFNNAYGTFKIDKITNAYFNGISKIRINYLLKYLNKNRIKCSKVLEIGPGPGNFADNWLKLHSNTKYFAVETDSTCHESLKKIGVDVIDLKKSESLKVDLIVISHVLEHVSDPISFLNTITFNLKKGGVLFIDVPCSDYLHKELHEPHLLFFDKLPMNTLLKKINFKNIEVSYHGEEISKLINKSIYKRIYRFIKNKLIRLGVIWPFAFKHSGMELIKDRLERASVSSSNAHKENTKPSWWLRSLSTKK